MNNLVGKNIKKIRIKKGFGLNETARIAKVSCSYLSHIENGVKENPSFDTLLKIADALGVSIDKFFRQDLIKEINKSGILITLSRDEFENLARLILKESLEENNSISIFIENGSVKFGVNKYSVKVIGEIKGGKYE
ncbi:helix-turn-helix domain-containing protein [Clostridium tertium]|jgi:transcriptional regulator with XRE-family HTH domain|uniref:Helix-turn-helix domain-containing protein n=1 Tax=Clostridium tertium TaxID=1559 RepID=A0A9X3XJU2_9CLOT|nr:helix-turn-helix domain-containing protein [Clostridium tertium]MDC4239636.1 helix-turn-helix domain-containing protein [Clostridium tertium]